jgi:phthiocerol/phenolphthiocerol synthesis type-I polyketide synthase E
MTLGVATVSADNEPVSAAERLVALWRDALHTDDVGVDDDFFELGGNSIVAVRLVPLIKESFGVEPHIGMIFDHPTPREFASVLLTLRAVPAKGAGAFGTQQ